MSEEQLLIRYCNNYNLDYACIDINKIYKHWNLEKQLVKTLLHSKPENRKEIFSYAYNKLYEELPWLVSTGSSQSPNISEEYLSKRWLLLFNDLNKKNIYEIGSGNGELIKLLAKKGAYCVATEISENRQNKESFANIEWHSSDGVNLIEYELLSQYDYVISDQLIEHLHPDDLISHFKNVYAILNSTGSYIFYTPNFFNGPGDVSLIFDCLVAEGMHLKEYKYFELVKILRNAGFRTIVTIEGSTNTKNYITYINGLKFKVFLALEALLSKLPYIKISKKIYRKIQKYFNIHNEIVLKAIK